ncbi:hypothetical protein EOL70_12950 [Leucothrix sargassi]|nr:hypothetical protein EOL70_12950 [Leucothrix sargassi]
MSSETFFTIGLIIAIASIIEALTLQKNRGQLSKLVVSISLLEGLWVVICIYALFAVSFPAWTLIIPAGYISYFIVNCWHYRNLTDGVETAEDFKTIRIPPGAVKISFISGILLLVGNLAALVLV